MAAPRGPFQTGHTVFRKAKSLVGLDIGSSAVKAVELKPVGKGYRVAAFGSRADAARQHRRRRHHRRRGRGRCDPAAVRRPRHPDQGRCRLALGQRRHRQEDHPAGDDRGRARRVHLLGGRAVHPLRHPGRQPRLPDPRRRRPAAARHDGRPAGRREEREDRRLHRRDRPGRPHARWSSTSTPSRCRTPTRSTTASSRAPSSVLLNAGASATNINILSGEQSVFTRDISIGGNAYTEALQRELNLPFEHADQLKRGAAGRRRDASKMPGRCCAR